jgi:hypothetical protein
LRRSGWSEKCPARGNRLNGSNQIPAGLRFLNATVHPGAPHFIDEVFGLVHRENQDGATAAILQYLRSGLQAIHFRHAHVHHHHVRHQPGYRRNGVFTIRRFSHYPPIRTRFLHDGANALANHLVVVDD